MSSSSSSASSSSAAATLWVDRYRPTSLDKLDYHKDQAEQLRRLAQAGDLPHMLFYGPSGAGKKTRVMALLRAIFGPGVERVRLEHRPFKTPSGKAIEMTTVASAFHIEINPGDAGIYDRFVVQDIIKEMAASVPLVTAPAVAPEASPSSSSSSSASSASSSSASAPPFPGATASTGNFKVVLLSEVDRMTKEAQAALRRTMEKFSATTRLILVCCSPSRVIEPVRSRCLGIRVGAPTQQEVIALLTATALKENLTLPMVLAAKIAAQSGRNLRRAILALEAAKAQCYPFQTTQAVPLMDYERYTQLLAADVLREQSPQQLLACRARVYELIVNCVPADVIIKKLVHFIVEKVAPDREALKHDLMSWAAHYEHRMNLGQKELFHVEALIARIMSVLRANAGAFERPGAR